ncbi:MAG: hypothetical protein Q8P25_00460 [Candidatus Curtissbacteria bacterium]|nr:hypothetical protein [Candidatus Curtissbacteria bacterium]
MTKEIEFQVASLEHLTKQPFKTRYALFCDLAKNGEYGLACESVRRGGHLGDYETSSEAIEDGTVHPHPVIIRFYPLEGGQKPDWENNKLK